MPSGSAARSARGLTVARSGGWLPACLLLSGLALSASVQATSSGFRIGLTLRAADAPAPATPALPLPGHAIVAPAASTARLHVATMSPDAVRGQLLSTLPPAGYRLREQTDKDQVLTMHWRGPDAACVDIVVQRVAGTGLVRIRADGASCR